MLNRAFPCIDEGVSLFYKCAFLCFIIVLPLFYKSIHFVSLKVFSCIWKDLFSFFFTLFSCIYHCFFSSCKPSFLYQILPISSLIICYLYSKWYSLFFQNSPFCLSKYPSFTFSWTPFLFLLSYFLCPYRSLCFSLLILICIYSFAYLF